MRAHFLIDLIMLSFIEEADVDGVDHRLEDVGIHIVLYMSVFELCLNLIGKALCIFQHNGEEALHSLGYQSVALFCLQVPDLYDLCIRQIYIYIYIIYAFMHTQDVMRILMTRLNQCIYLHPVDRKYCFSSSHSFTNPSQNLPKSYPNPPNLRQLMNKYAASQLWLKPRRFRRHE